MPQKTAIHYYVILFILLLPVNGQALTLPYAGFAYGPSSSSDPVRFDPDSNLYAYFGIQTEYLVTYELGLSSFDYTTFDSQPENRAGNMLMGSAMFHMPVEDSSVFIRFGFAAYQYYNQQLEVHDVFITVYGAGLDLALSQKVSLRLEWQRHKQLEYHGQYFYTKTLHGGLFFYF